MHIRSEVTRAAEPVMLHDEDGEVAVYAVPYLEPDVVRSVLGDSLRTHGGVLRAAADLCRDDLAQRARLGMRSVVMAHAFVAGGSTSTSERELMVGGAGQVAPSTFDGFDYVALGHLHGPQVIGDGSVRYAGSPLAYSFSEDRHAKKAWLVELDAQGLRSVEAVPTVTPRPLVRLRGTMESMLADPALAHAEQAFVSAVVTDLACPVGAMASLQRRFPHAVELSWQPEGGLLDLGGTYASRIAKVDDLELVSSFVRHVRNSDPSSAERTRLREALDEATLRRVEV